MDKHNNLIEDDAIKASKKKDDDELITNFAQK